jgi:hypothetical protein
MPHASSARTDLAKYLGRNPDGLNLSERLEVAGSWFALELYDPATLPLRHIEAIGESASACVRQLESRGLDPSRYEFMPFKAPY